MCCRIFASRKAGSAAATPTAAAAGPLATRRSRYQDPLVDAYLERAQTAGYPLNDDYNGASQDGFALMQMTIRNGRRESAATAYLHPALSRDNLTVTVNAHVTRVVLEGSRAVGVEYLKDGENALRRGGAAKSSFAGVRSIRRSS